VKRRIYHRWLVRKVNVRYLLNTPERYSHLYDTQSKEVARLRKKISEIAKHNNVVLDSNLNSDLASVMKERTEKVHQECPEGSFRRVFWDQQLKSAKVKNPKQMRWHPAVIKWCLHLKYISSGCYHAVRSSGLLCLPSERTLRDYSNWIRPGVGFSAEVDAQLKKEANVSEEKDKIVVLIWDEMKIREDLVFNKHTCDLVGFLNIGDVNAQLDKVGEDVHPGKKSRQMASHMLLFMVRGVFTKPLTISPQRELLLMNCFH